VRVIIAVGRGTGARRLALLLGFVCGLVWLAFSTASHGISPESAIGGGIIAFTALGLRWPRLGGSLLALAGLASLVFFILLPPGRQDMAGFHPDGSLDYCFLVDRETIDGLQCEEGTFWGEVTGGVIVQFHPDGKLKSCRLAADATIAGQTFKKGKRIWLDEEGKPMPKPADP
jgi:hypothetical protein